MLQIFPLTITLDIFIIMMFILLIVLLLAILLTRYLLTKGTVLKSNYNALKEEISREKNNLEDKLESKNQELKDSQKIIGGLEANKESLNERIQQHEQDLEQMQEKFKTQFENLANRIFEEKSSVFKKDSETNLTSLLNPLKEQLKEFDKKIEKSFGEQAKEQFSLRNEIEKIVLANGQIMTQAENLTKALKGEAKVQGNWGEMVLEKILEASGLRKGEEYILQAQGIGSLKDSEGQLLRPDVIINLPEGKHIIIDSKMSLVPYERYCAEKETIQSSQFLQDFLSSIKLHVSSLEKKGYQNIQQLITPDFVFMFIPIEGAYSLAMQQDNNLHEEAWRRRIILVCPSTLLATLKTVESVWRVERQNKNIIEISQKASSMYDKFVSFVEDMKDIGKAITSSQEKYDDAFKKLSSGKGNLITKADELTKLGVKGKKRLPNSLIESDNS